MHFLTPGRLWPWVYDRTMRRTERRGLCALRLEALSAASGRTLEVGAGTGANLEAYPDAAFPLVLTEPDRYMARRLRHRADRVRPAAQVIEAEAVSLPFPDASFDTVVVALVLCTVADPAAALGEIRRVLRPGGRLVFLEHVRSDSPRVARGQDRWQPAWSLITGGCHPNRDTAAAIAAAGFRVDKLRRDRLPASPRLVRPLVLGVATRDA